MKDWKNQAVLSVTTTVGSLPEAQALARDLLGQRLAACVQVQPGLGSHYRWQGVLREDPEVRLTIKTVPACMPALQTWFELHHPYQLPQLLVSEMAASVAYAQWVRAETSPAHPG